MGLQEPNAELLAWLQSNTYHHGDFTIPQLADIVKSQRIKVTVIIPARNVASTVGDVLDKAVKPLVEGKVVKSVIAIDANCEDGTGRVAAEHGATVLQRAEIAPELGPSLGKGDGMWRSLLATSKESTCEKEIVAFLDGDTNDPAPSHLLGIIAPLITNDKLHMVRGCFDRPYKLQSGEVRPHEGGRVTELVARPLLNRHFPSLAGFRQPFAGEFAARRVLLEKLAFPVGYGVEIGTLIDASKMVGAEGIAQCDLGTRQNEHKPLRNLGTMALAILNTAERRVDRPDVKGHALADMMYLPWEMKNETVSAVERQPISEYSVPHKRVLAPFVNIQKVLNFRDIGGAAIAPGFFVRQHLIYRSADFRNLTPLGTQQLQALNIKAVFDLRSNQEVEKVKASGGEAEFAAWTAMPDGPRYHHVPIFADWDYSPEGIAERFKAYSSEGTEGFVTVYRSILLNSGKALREILAHLRNDTTSHLPLILHCTAGKDRTAVIVMVLLLLAGCSKGDIAKEYNLTEAGLGQDWRSNAIERLKVTHVFEGSSVEVIERMISARREVMEAIVGMVEEEFGGAEKLLTAKMGVDQRTIEAAKKVLRQRRSGTLEGKIIVDAKLARAAGMGPI